MSRAPRGLIAVALTVVLAAAPAGCGEKEEPSASSLSTPSPLLTALREGGHVLVFRHATTEAKTDRVETARSCATQRALTRAGVAQARAIGRDVEALGIDVGEIRTSPFCRARDTARAAFGRFEEDRALLPLAADGTVADDDRRVRALRRMVREAPREGTNTVLVTHTPNLGEAFGLSLDEGEAAVFRPGGDGEPEPVGRVKAGDWQRLDG